MNWEIASVVLTGIGVYLGLRAQVNELKSDISAANKRIDDTIAITNTRLDATNLRLDDTWKVLLTITREIASIKQDKK